MDSEHRARGGRRSALETARHRLATSASWAVGRRAPAATQRACSASTSVAESSSRRRAAIGGGGGGGDASFTLVANYQAHLPAFAVDFGGGECVRVVPGGGDSLQMAPGPGGGVDVYLNQLQLGGAGHAEWARLREAVLDPETPEATPQSTHSIAPS